MKNLKSKFMGILFVMLFGVYLSVHDVQAEETLLTPPKTTDLEKIELENAEKIPKVDKIWGFWEVDAPVYSFTKKSAGKYIPITSPVDGTVFYLCTDTIFMNSKKEEIKPSHNFSTEGMQYEIYDVKKGKTYYLYIPEDVEIGAMRTFVYPDNVKNIKMGVTYFQTGTGKNTYKYFTLKKLALIDFQVIHASHKGKNTTYYLQKKIKGKWKTITEKRAVIGDQHAESDRYRAPYGLSKGKYRLVTKTVRNGKFWIHPETKKCVNNGKSSKRKAKRIKYGSGVEGVFTYGDKKVHWYKVKVDRDVRLTFTTSMEPHGVTFTVYKKGIKNPVKVLKLKGKSGRKEWETYKRRRKYTLEDGDGWYYIKVSRKHAKANGWYRIEN